MDVGAIATNTAQAQSKTALSGNFDTFLRLLTTQLQHQDPLEPLDATKFTEQLVSYSQVEQQINTNDNLSTLIALTKAAAGANAVTYLGKTALTAGPVTSLDNDTASWRYTLGRDAAATQLIIKDATGRAVRTLTGERGVGIHDFIWDGRNEAGTQLPAGAYTLSVVATASDGSNVPATVAGVGFIKEVDMSAGEPLLTVGGRKVRLAEVIGLKN
jgi:flagellar basal-body rod modification protein FlgD